MIENVSTHEPGLIEEEKVDQHIAARLDELEKQVKFLQGKIKMNKQQPLENALKSPKTKKQKNSILANKSSKQIKRKKGNT